MPAPTRTLEQPTEVSARVCRPTQRCDRSVMEYEEPDFLPADTHRKKGGAVSKKTHL
ncbi:hypothetical protein CHARACLAT_013907, partial [Characodon lateralis]|nr:hypothetical protein [Characodon lateralis]